MPPQVTDVDAETAVRDAVAGWIAAARSKDLDRIMALYVPEVVAFDAVMKHRFQGTDAYRQHWQTCMEMCPGEMVMEPHDLVVTVRDDIAFCHYLLRCGHRDEKGNEQSGWMRATTCFARHGGRWLVAHEHLSAPFDPESGKAVWELTL